jgi:ATP-dependent protease ClpP protease subunit
MSPKKKKGRISTRRFNASDIENYLEYNFDKKLRRIYITSVNTDAEGNESGIDTSLFEYIAKALDILETENDQFPISFVLNSEGGCWSNSLAIYDRILESPCPTSMRIYGSAFSGAPVILQAADERLIAYNATLMLHDGTVTANGAQSTRDFEKLGDFSKRVDRPRMYDILTMRSKLTKEDIKSLCIDDKYFTSKMALRYGFVDRIIEPQDTANPTYSRFKVVERKVKLKKKKP